MKSKRPWMAALMGIGLSAGVAQADYVNNFDTAPYSTQNGVRLSSIGNDNVTGTAWTVVAGAGGVLGAGLDAIASTAHPFGGSGGHLRMTDTASSGNVSARLNLSSVLNLTSTFTVSFKMTTTDLAGGWNAAITFGEDSSLGNSHNWLSIYSSGPSRNVKVEYRTAALGGSFTLFTAKQANGTSNFVYGDNTYFDVFAKINPTTYRYESLKIDGVEQLGLGGVSATIYVPATATPAKAFRFYSGGGSTTGTIDIDNVSIVVPEPATLGLMALGGLLMVGRHR